MIERFDDALKNVADGVKEEPVLFLATFKNARRTPCVTLSCSDLPPCIIHSLHAVTTACMLVHLGNKKKNKKNDPNPRHYYNDHSYHTDEPRVLKYADDPHVVRSLPDFTPGPDFSLTETSRTQIRDVFLAARCTKVVSVPWYSFFGGNNLETFKTYLKDLLEKEAGIVL